MGFNCSAHSLSIAHLHQTQTLHSWICCTSPGLSHSPEILAVGAELCCLVYDSQQVPSPEFPGTAQGRGGSGGWEELAPSAPDRHHWAGNVPLQLSFSSRVQKKKGWILKHRHLYRRNNCCNIFLRLISHYSS